MEKNIKFVAYKDDDDSVLVNGKKIDLTASGTEDWEIASNIIRQLDK